MTRVYWIEEWYGIDDKTFYLLMGSITKPPLLKKLSLDLSNNSITQAGLTAIKPFIKSLKNAEEININLNK